MGWLSMAAPSTSPGKGPVAQASTWWLGMVGAVLVLTVLLELALTAADMGAHDFTLLHEPAQVAWGLVGWVLRGLRAKLLAGELLKRNSPQCFGE